MTPILSTKRRHVFVAAIVILLVVVARVELQAQQGPQPSDDVAASGETDPGPPAETTKQSGPKLLQLLSRGGWFMLPLGLMSVLVIAISIERLLALRRQRVLPDQLIRELGKLSQVDTGFDPRDAFQLAAHYPSAAARVLQAMLMKVGRPQAEVEHAVSEASQREADRMYLNVRWLTLGAAVAPLVGLLGTVWGMIDAFYKTTQLVAGQDKAEQLADGIYTALITTLCGLVIAIPAAIFAQFCESRISKLFHEIDEMIFNLMPQIERFEGKVRFSRQAEPVGNTERASSSSIDSDDEDQSPIGSRTGGSTNGNSSSRRSSKRPTSPSQ